MKIVKKPGENYFGMGGPRKDLSKDQCLMAIKHTQSNAAAARYLNVSFPHYRKWAKVYEATEPGYPNLWEQHKNQFGKGIPKFLNRKKKGEDNALLDIIEGRATTHSFKPEKIKQRLIAEGYLAEQCNLCNFQERRVIDHKVPLLFNFQDGNKENYKLDNVELVCYNCYFLTVGNIFTKKELTHLEDFTTNGQSTEPEWELDEYQQEMLKNLGLEDNTSEEDYISRPNEGD